MKSFKSNIFLFECLIVMPSAYLLIFALVSGQQIVSLSTASVGPSKVPAALDPWEIPEECVLEGLEFWQTGCYGPICKGLLKKKGGASSVVVVKCLRGTV